MVRRRRWVRAFLCLFAITILFSTLTSASSGLRVNEAASKFLFEKERTGPRLAIENSLGHEMKARVFVELIDPQGVVKASAERNEEIKAGVSSLFIPLDFQPANLKEAEREQLLWYRLRYQITPQESSSAVPETDGTVSLSELTPDIFEVRVTGYEFAFAGARFHARLHAAHPLSGRAIEGVEAETELKIDEDEERSVILRASGVTDAEGNATIDFNLPASIKTDEGEFKITARRGTLIQEVEDNIHFDQISRILISTDKPLYQPGQMLHARALVFSPLMKIVAGEKTPFKIEDPEGTIVFRAELQTSRFGIASVDWPIPENARLGDYAVSFGRNGASENFYTSYRIKISRYDLPNFTTRVKPDRPFYLSGQSAEVEVRADYLFGQAVRRGHVRVVRETEREWNYREQKWEIKEGDKYEGETDADGRFVAHINLEKEQDDLRDSDWRRFDDVSYAAYFTDPSTNRTEQRRFDLRVTKEPIHVYVISGTDDQSSRLPLEFYISTFYADGAPAPCNVLVREGSAEDDRSGRYERDGGRRVAVVKTNSFGLAKVVIPKPPLNKDRDEVYLRFAARDAKGQTGHQNERFSYEDEAGLRVRTDKTLHRPGEPIQVNLLSSEQSLEVFVDVVKDLQVLRSEPVHLQAGRASLTIPYDKQFKGMVNVVACASTGARDRVCGGRNVLYPRNNDLKLDARPAQTTYRPGDEARINFSVLAPDGRAVESALGITIFDSAVEERARADQEFGSRFNFYGNYDDLFGRGDSLAGVTRRELERLDFSKPLPNGLELLAEVMLSKDGSYSPNEFSGDDYNLYQQKAFADLLQKQFDPVRVALTPRLRGSALYPRDEGMLRRMLAEFNINPDNLSDPWGTPYRSTFYVRTDQDMLKFESAGADKRFGTDDDFTAAEFGWPYFQPTGEAIDRSVRKYHERTGGYIRDIAMLQAEMLGEGVDLNGLRDRWGEPYRVIFDTNGVNYVLKVTSSGPDRRLGTPDSPGDDFTLWTSTIDYFAERRAEINNALSSELRESHNFPRDMQGLRGVLSKSKIDFDALRDAWGHRYYATFKTESRYTDRVTVETLSKLGEKPLTHTEIKPVTQQLGIVTLRSAGMDGVEATSDDFDAATFSLVLSEQARGEAQTKPTKSLPLLTGEDGAITGVAIDPMGAVIPGANVRATLTSTEQFYESVTDDEGNFALTNLPPGTYEVRVTAGGFKSTVLTNVFVSKLNVITLSITLEVGTTSEAVTITGDAPRLETERGNFTIGGTRARSNNFSAEYGRNSGAVLNVITKSGTSDGLVETSTPRLREYFPETLVWQPSLETDARGRAEFRFKLADNITTWKLAVIGSTVGGEIGMAEKEILAFQPFFVDHDPPRILTEGDEIQLPIVLRNYLGKPQTVELEMKPENWFTLLGPAAKHAEVPAGDNSRQIFDFRAIASVKDGRQRVTAKGAGVASDQIERSVSVHPDGEEVAKTASGILGDGTTLETEIPGDVINQTARAELKIYPSLLAHVVESIEGIMERPYGCAEQTISAAYPSLLALRAYKSLGKEHPAIEAKARRYVQQGYERLLNYRAAGGFSYWGHGDADTALTAYALRFLHDAQEFITVDEGVTKEAREWLGNQQRGDGRWPAMLRWEKTEDKRRTALLTAYIARVLAMTGDKESTEETPGGKTTTTPAISATLKRALQYLSEQSKELDEPYLIASYALAALDTGDVKAAEAAVAKLLTLSHEEAGGSYWSLETNTPFYGWGLAGRIETTAIVLQALNKYCGLQNSECGLSKTASSNPQSVIGKLQSAGLLFLLRQQDRYGVWYSTQATVNTLDTLVALLSTDTRADAGGPAQILVNGKAATSVEMPSGDQLASPLMVDLSQFISTGNNQIEIRRAAGSARASAQIVSTYYVPWKAAGATAHSTAEDAARALRLSINFDRTTAKAGEEVTCKVKAERVGFKGYGMLLAEIGLPPGADVDRATLETAMQQAGVDRYDVLPDRVVVYLWPEAGGSNFEFKFRPRFGLVAQSAPSQLYDYYNPEARVVVAPTKFVVK